MTTTKIDKELPRFYYGYKSNGEKLCIPNEFLPPNGCYMKNTWYPVRAECLIGKSKDEKAPYPYATKQDVFYLDPENTLRISLDYDDIYSDDDDEDSLDNQLKRLYAKNPLYFLISVRATKEKVEIDEVKELIKNGVDVNFDDGGWTSLMETPKRNLPEVAKLLIEAGANVDAKNNDGLSTLMIASMIGSTEIVKSLIDAGCDVNAKSNKGRSSLLYATSSNHTEIVKLLEKAGAKL